MGIVITSCAFLLCCRNHFHRWCNLHRRWRGVILLRISFNLPFYLWELRSWNWMTYSLFTFPYNVIFCWNFFCYSLDYFSISSVISCSKASLSVFVKKFNLSQILYFVHRTHSQ
jgi:hypothetical protein